MALINCYTVGFYRGIYGKGNIKLSWSQTPKTHPHYSNEFNSHLHLYHATLCMIWVAYLTAIGYGIDEAAWIKVDETPIPYPWA